MFDTDPLDDHIELVQTVEAAGIAPPEEWQALRARLRSFGELSDQTLRDQLTDAVVGGADANIPLLRALALAEVANHQQVTTVTGAVRNAVLAQMRQVFDAAARDVYAAVAAKYDQAAKRFTTAASTIDVEADPVSMIEQPDKLRRAWLDSEKFGNELTRLLPAMSAGATLAGIPDADTDAMLLPLVVDTTGAHRRRVWEGWVRDQGRCGRWGALLRCGCVLRASALDEYPGAYAEPRPLEYRREQVGNGGVRTVDPEDNPPPPPPTIDPRKGKPGRMAAI